MNDNSIMKKTPFFLIKEKLISDNINSFKDALSQLWPNSIIAYSVKTNALPWVLRWMNEHHVYAEVVSDEEYQLSLLSGYSDEHIVFNGPIKGDQQLKRACEKGAIINLDSEHELMYLRTAKPQVRGKIGIRINVDPNIFDTQDVGFQKDGFRFGYSYKHDKLTDTVREISDLYGSSFGLHMHVNSITRSLNVYKAIAHYAAHIIEKEHLRPAYVDIGGGFFGGVPGKTTPYEYIEGIKKELELAVDPSATMLIIEPGSAIIGSAIELHTSVLDVKDTDYARIVTTDGSRLYIDPLWGKNSYMYSLSSDGASIPRQVICGYTCMDHDRIMILEDAPELSVGDKIIYHRVGNYTVTFGGPFIRPYPAVYAECDGKIETARNKMSVEDYFRMEN